MTKQEGVTRRTGGIYHARAGTSTVLGGFASQKFLDRLYGRIAWRYDLVNTLQSLGTDACARRKAASVVATGTVLDLGTGTGKLAAAVLRKGAARVVCMDRSVPMLTLAAARFKDKRFVGKVYLVRGDAGRLPFKRGVFDGVVSAFVLRNVPNLPGVLAEAARVSRPGASFATVDTLRPPRGWWGALYELYLRTVIPVVGRLLTGDAAAFRYLVVSIRRCFTGEALAAATAAAGFQRVRRMGLLGGIMELVTGVRL